MELVTIHDTKQAILSLLERNRTYTFDKIVAILYANDYDVDDFLVARALMELLAYPTLLTSNHDDALTLFSLA